MNIIMPQPPGPAPWRIVVLDPEPGDPKHLLTEVLAVIAAESADPPLGWARHVTGDPGALLVPMPLVSAWRVEEPR